MNQSLAKKWWPLGAAVVALVVLAAAMVWFVRREETGEPRMATEEARALIEQKDLALGQLENALFQESLAGFTALGEKLPQEPLPIQNRLLGLLWALRDDHAYAGGGTDTDRRQDVLQEAGEALMRLRQLSDDAALLHYLEAQLAQRRGDTSAAVEQLRQAAAADPENVLYPAQIYEILSQSPEPGAEDEARAALATAWRLSPENLYLVRKQAVTQVRQRDPNVVETLEVMRRAYAPFFGTVRDHLPGFEMGQAINTALAAVEAGEWPRAIGQVSFADNAATRLAAQQFDHWRLNPHELEFVLYDFSPQFYAGVDLPPPPAPEAIPVRLAAAPQAWRLPETADATAVRLADFDLDGRWDLIVVRPRRLEVYGRTPQNDGWRALAAYDLPEGLTGVTAADLDRDIHENLPLAARAAPADGEPQQQQPQCLLADVDLIVHGPAGVLLLKNVYDRQADTRSLEAMTEDEQLAAVENVLAAAVADVDHDGDLDLVLATEQGVSLWSNRENFTFENITEHSQPPPAAFHPTTIIPVDWDRDVYLDLLMADAAGEIGLWRNFGHRNFRWEAVEGASAAPGDANGQQARPAEGPARQAGPTAAVLDADGNAAWDALVAGPRGARLIANANPRAGVVRPIETSELTDAAGAGLIPWDYDNDGYLDVLAWTEDGVLAFRGLPGGAFQAVENLFADPPPAVRNAHAADLDHDGDLDVLFETAAGPALYLNEGGNVNQSLPLSLGADLEAQLPRERVNMHGIGSLLELKAGPLYQPRVVDRQIMHFGLGKRKMADLVRVLWTNGVPQNVINPITGQMICLEQKLKGSCPYVYVWDGKQWVFLTDCLWSAPLGLQFARGVLAPAREWEYLTVPGERLPEIDGEYRLMITEELWEAAYLDEVRLIAVDHPDDVEIFSNEKVGPPEIAEFRIHTVRHPRTPVAARNHRGRDVLELIARRDKKFVQLFDTGERQGVVEPHYLELHLGELDKPQQITLFLAGWNWPTDTSINVAIDENPDLAPPQPPSLWVPNAEGQWVEAIPYLGFPGGKTKTMAVDISHVFPTDDYRLRIQTSMEIYWDAAFFSVDEQTAPTRQQEAPLRWATLRYRGFSHRGPREHFGPESYDATRVDPAPQWPPMLGCFTRYGEATELVRRRDDRLAVLAAGDALELRFQKPAVDPPPGWTRSFLLYNVGWDKDADLNTVLGQTAEPLPFAGMASYPLPADQPDPDSPQLREYRETYQTREQPRASFWRWVREFSAR